MTAYLITNVERRRRRADRPADPRRRRRRGRRGLTAPDADGDRRRRAGRPARPGRPAHPPARAGPRGRRDRASPAPGPRRSAATPRCARWPTPPRSPTPPAWSSRSGGSAGRPGWSTCSRSARSPSGLAGERLAELGAMADSAARVRIFSDDGHCVADPRLMRRALEYVKAFDGVIAQHAEEPRLTEGAQMHEGEVADPARADRLAGGRRGGDHRPGRAARRARRRPAARLPRLHRRQRRDAPPGQGARRAGDRRGDPAPPAAHRRAGAEPTTRSSRSTRRCAPPPTSPRCAPALADGIDRRRRHRPRPARRGGQGVRVGVRPAGHARPGDGAVDRAATCSAPQWDLIAERMSRTPGPDRRAGRARPRPGARARRPTSPWSTRPPAGRSTRRSWPAAAATPRTPA